MRIRVERKYYSFTGKRFFTFLVRTLLSVVKQIHTGILLKVLRLGERVVVVVVGGGGGGGRERIMGEGEGV